MFAKFADSYTLCTHLFAFKCVQLRILRFLLTSLNPYTKVPPYLLKPVSHANRLNTSFCVLKATITCK